ncbi:hypothetical protein L1887_57884 [Cichorium endivia]|nr:hypothetical protein L1887_57884 [Cichorium endivia]
MDFWRFHKIHKEAREPTAGELAREEQEVEEILLGEPDGLDLAVGGKTSGTMLGTDTGALHTTERNGRMMTHHSRDPHGTALDLASDALGGSVVRTPNGGTKTPLGVVDTLDEIGLVLPLEQGHDGAEGLLLDELAVLGRVVDDAERVEVAFLLLDLASRDEVELLVLGLLEELADLVILHLVVDGTKHDALLVTGAHLEVLNDLGECRLELVVDVLVDVDALGGDADLARVEEGTEEHVLCGGGHVRLLREHDARVVATELEGEALERGRAALGDEAASDGATGERDLLDARVLGDPRAEVVVTNDDLDDTGREDLLRSLDDADVAERGEGRGLDDDAVTGDKGLGHLPEHEQDGEVPGHDTGANTEREVTLDGAVGLILVLDLLVKADLGELGEPGEDALALVLGEHDRLALLGGEQLDELGRHGLELFAVLFEQLGTLVPRGLGPRRESGLGGIDGLVDGLLGGDGHLCDHLFGGGVDDVEHLCALGINGLAVDDVRERRIEELGGDTDSHCGRGQLSVRSCARRASCRARRSEPVAKWRTGSAKSDSQPKAGTRSHKLGGRLRGTTAGGLFGDRSGGGGAQSLSLSPVTPRRRLNSSFAGVATRGHPHNLRRQAAILEVAQAATTAIAASLSTPQSHALSSENDTAAKGIILGSQGRRSVDVETGQSSCDKEAARQSGRHALGRARAPADDGPLTSVTRCSLGLAGLSTPPRLSARAAV